MQSQPAAWGFSSWVSVEFAQHRDYVPGYDIRHVEL